MDRIGSITVEEALQKASFRLKQAGLEQPRNEAEILLMSLQGWDRLKLFLERVSVLDKNSINVFWTAVERRAHNEPLAYIIGMKEFYGLDFSVNRKVLIPRPETELLVDAVLEWAGTREETSFQGVDLGCGSGNIAVTLAYHLPEACFYAVDFSSEALQVAKANALRHGVYKRIKFIQGNFLDAFSKVEPTPLFNLVVSNPPYISEAELKNLPHMIRDYEPRLSLNGGPDGLAAYRNILALLPHFLKAPGMIALEIGSTQGDALLSLCQKQAFFQKLILLNDYQNFPRILIGLF